MFHQVGSRSYCRIAALAYYGLIGIEYLLESVSALENNSEELNQFR